MELYWTELKRRKAESSMAIGRGLSWSQPANKLNMTPTRSIICFAVLWSMVAAKTNFVILFADDMG